MAASVAALVGESEILFLCLPSATHVRAVFEGDGILKNIRKGQIVVDLGTSSVSQTRDFASAVAGKGRIMGRCADRTHPSGRAGWNAERHGRRDAASCSPRSSR